MDAKTDRTLYWTVPHASGWELLLEPWPDDRFHRTEFGIHRPVSHFMKNSRDGNTFGDTNLEIGHRYSFMDSTARTSRTTRLELQYYPRPDDRTSELNLGFPELNLGFYWCSGMLLYVRLLLSRSHMGP
ncbi:hypothetical protein DY000_02015726 [Brassica cretica]|uniref:Uncharacterized protein n=1 Tax=Brassica cretica TaxID=69181 RepID=A0ABQ7D8E8_BRACR|nr:hypothetical protein DY000_02015726 [Brassica cretica]